MSTESSWSAAASARRAARCLLELDDASSAFERLLDAGHHHATMFDLRTAADLFREAAAIGDIPWQQAEEALVLAAVALASLRTSDVHAERIELWQRLLDHAQTDNARARALLHLHAEGVEQDGADLLGQARDIAAPGWSDRARYWRAISDGDLEAAHEHVVQALERARHQRDRLLEAASLESLGGVLAWLGRIDDAIDVYHHAVTASTRYGDASRVVSARTAVVEMHCLALRAEPARAEQRQLTASTSAIESQHVAILVATQHVRTDLLRGAATEARDHAATLIDRISEADAREPHGELALVRACEAAIEAGDDQLAARALRALGDGDSMGSGMHIHGEGVRALHVRFLHANQELELEDVATCIEELDPGDAFLRAELAAWLAWHAQLRADHGVARRAAALLDGISPHPQDVQLDALCSFARAVDAWTDPDRLDARPLRALSLRLARVGAGTHIADRVAAAALLCDSTTADSSEALLSIRASLADRGCIRDVDAIDEAIAELRPDVDIRSRRIQLHPALANLADDARSHLIGHARDVVVDAGERIDVGSDVLLVDEGVVGVTDEHGIAHVAGAHGHVRCSDTAGEHLVALSAVRGWRVPAGTIEHASAPVGVVSRAQDAGISVRDRILALLRELGEVTSHVPDGDHLRLDMHMTQSDIAALARTSRKSASLVLNELRRDGIARVSRGQVEIARTLLHGTSLG